MSYLLGGFVFGVGFVFGQKIGTRIYAYLPKAKTMIAELLSKR